MTQPLSLLNSRAFQFFFVLEQKDSYNLKAQLGFQRLEHNIHQSVS